MLKKMVLSTVFLSFSVSAHAWQVMKEKVNVEDTYKVTTETLGQGQTKKLDMEVVTGSVMVQVAQDLGMFEKTGKKDKNLTQDLIILDKEKSVTVRDTRTQGEQRLAAKIDRSLILRRLKGLTIEGEEMKKIISSEALATASKLEAVVFQRVTAEVASQDYICEVDEKEETKQAQTMTCKTSYEITYSAAD